MWRPGQVERCAFCGRTIEAGEERVGRGESAAHVACADAALGDDRLWEGVGGPEARAPGDAANAGGDAPRGAEMPGSATPSSTGSRRGCFAVAVGVLLLSAVALRRTM